MIWECNVQVQLKLKENASTVAPYSKSYERSLIKTIIDSEDGGSHAVGIDKTHL